MPSNDPTNDRLDRMDTEIRRLHGRVSGVSSTVNNIDKCLAVVAANTERLPELVDRVTEVEKTVVAVKAKAEAAAGSKKWLTGVVIAVVGWVIAMWGKGA